MTRGYETTFGRVHRVAVRALLVLAALLALPVAPAHAAPTDATRDAATLDAALPACTARVRPGDTPAAILADPARFDCRTRQSAFGPGNFWVRIELPAARWQAIDGTPLLTFMPSWQRSATLFLRSAGGQLVAHPLDNRTLSRFGMIGAQVAIPLDLGGQRVDTALLRIDGAVNASGLLQVPRLTSERNADRHHLVEAAVYAAFAGLLIALLSYNLLLWVATPARFQAYYCLTLTAMLAYTFSHSGALDMLLPQLGAEARFRFSYLALALIAAFAMAFLTTCLEPRTVPRRLRQVNALAGWTTAMCGLAVLFSAPQWAHAADRVYVLSFLPIPALAILVAVSAWRRGSQIVKLLALAWFMPFCMALVRIAHAANLIGFSLWVEHSAVIALALEALLSALAMSFRIKRIARERDTARAEERVARRLAEIDPLTGLCNRRALLNGALGWGADEDLRLVLVDIDHFKAINDRHGHVVGDEVLCEVAAVLAATAELRGTVARLGGEEFALLGASAELDADLPRRLLEAVRGHVMPGGISVTVSLGTATGRIAAEADWRELYRRADQALYRAKSTGRNRCELAEPAALAA